MRVRMCMDLLRNVGFPFLPRLRYLDLVKSLLDLVKPYLDLVESIAF